ncbi:MAG: isochorismatase family protein, partial [Nitriliruptorales bacterium]|nr:isochorismatase family protein [Nitriliruptorales bacterium]
DRERRRYEIVEQAAPWPGEAVLHKTAPSAFFGTPLMAHLHSLGVDTLMVCGESTSGCVRASVIDARSYRFKVIVVEDAVYDRHESAHAINLFDMNQKYADVMALDDVLVHLRARIAGPTLTTASA